MEINTLLLALAASVHKCKEYHTVEGIMLKNCSVQFDQFLVYFSFRTHKCGASFTKQLTN